MNGNKAAEYYYLLRSQIAKVIPRNTVLFKENKPKNHLIKVKEKGRKKNYHQFNIIDGKMNRQERLLNTEEINSFLEISVRASACPMPFNMDIWDGLTCPFNCIYCYANSFRVSLYTSFFDNSKTMGFRHMNPDKYKVEMDKMEKFRSYNKTQQMGLSGINKAFSLGIPLRMGIRFEDFLKNEKRDGISLEMLEYLKKIEYPVMLNTKSDLVGEVKYAKALGENKGKSAVHMTLISSDNRILKILEPGAPSYEKRLNAMKMLVEAGVRVVARIEPYLFLINDEPEWVQKWIEDVWGIGVRHITFDTYSYTAHNDGIRQIFRDRGYDYDRMFIVGADSQLLGSAMLGAFMNIFREAGFSCSTFDMGNASTNDQDICCEVGDWFEDSGFNYGCTVMAARFIKQRGGKKTTWADFKEYVDSKGGFLTNSLEKDVKQLWNLEGNYAYSHSWAEGLKTRGLDEDGVIWIYDENEDERKTLLNTLL
jgi:DNA repair photolyase